MRDLSDAGASFALVGGVAIGARVALRFTRDLDLAVAVADDAEAEQVCASLIRSGYRPMMEIDQSATNRLATMRFRPRIPRHTDVADVPLVDVIFCTCGIEPEIVATAEPIPVFANLSLPTARIPHLIAMKVLSESDDRLQDRIDLQALIASATDADLAEAPPLLDLIAERGFARGKDLHAVFARFRDTSSA
jgi:hypothetical protein